VGAIFDAANMAIADCLLLPMIFVDQVSRLTAATEFVSNGSVELLER